MNQTFSALVNEKIELFKYSFASAMRQAFIDPVTGKLHHAGEIGACREVIVRDCDCSASRQNSQFKC